MAADERKPERPHVLLPLEQDAPRKQWLLSEDMLERMLNSTFMEIDLSVVLKQTFLESDGCTQT